MSYTATTIGFGEVPHPFSYAQRLWMTVSIYITVIGWAYTLGSVFALARHPAFRIALGRYRFEARVRRMTDPFFVVCGYGQSGRKLVAALDEIGFGTVVLESDPDRARAHLELELREHHPPRRPRRRLGEREGDRSGVVVALVVIVAAPAEMREFGLAMIGLFSLLLRDPARHAPRFYDSLEFCKGPNLGTYFSLCCPFTLLAHFGELEWAERCGVSRYLLRFSVGLESPSNLIDRLSRALAGL